MISIIICSRTPRLPQSLVENVANTIGCTYEWVVIDNSENRYSIFEAYNLGIKKSKGDYWCFMHDDILLHTMGWGEVLFDVFKSNESIGLIGIAGAKVKTKMPSAWWDCDDQFIRMHLKQHFKDGAIKDWKIGIQTSPLEEVVAIDGVFMVARKDERIRFLESLKGFHNYDLNLSFEYLQKGYKIMVTNLIYLEHFSFGTLDASWYVSTLKIHIHYFSLLPLSVIESFNFRSLEFKNGGQFLQGICEHKMYSKMIKFWIRLSLRSVYEFYLQLKKIIAS